jgi:predicted Zn-dependent protease
LTSSTVWISLGFALWLAAAPQGGDTAGLDRLEKAAAERPRDPRVWYALGQAYNHLKQDALATFGRKPEDAPWEQLIVADALASRDRLTDAFVLYRETLERLPAMVSIHDSVAGIYARTGHAAWAAREREAGALPAADCARRRALCEFRAGRHRASLDAALRAEDAESRYWRVRSAAELALTAFRRLDDLPDSVERRAVRATQARAEERHKDAIAELQAALTFVPGERSLRYELAAAQYAARDYDQAIATLDGLLEARPDDPHALKLKGYSLLQARRLEEAAPVLERASEADPGDPGPRIALGRAYVQGGNFAAAVPLIEPQLPGDRDGSLHLQLARAYTGLGQRDRAAALLAQSEALQRADQERNAAVARRKITGPK